MLAACADPEGPSIHSSRGTALIVMAPHVMQGPLLRLQHTAGMGMGPTAAANWGGVKVSSCRCRQHAVRRNTVQLMLTCGAHGSSALLVVSARHARLRAQSPAERAELTASLRLWWSVQGLPRHVAPSPAEWAWAAAPAGSAASCSCLNPTADTQHCQSWQLAASCC